VYLVNKKFMDAGIQRSVGEVVTGDGYKLIDKLIKLRYLTELGKKAKPVKCELCDRMFDSQETLEIHYLAEHPDEVEITDDSGGKGLTEE
jgi:hypothetical protein